MPLYLILHRVPDRPNQQSGFFEEIITSFIQKDRTAERIQSLKSLLDGMGHFSILEKTKWGAFFVTSDLSSEQLFEEIKSHVASYLDIDSTEFLVFGITELIGQCSDDTNEVLKDATKGLYDTNPEDEDETKDKESKAGEVIIAKKGKGKNRKRMSFFPISRCSHCNNIAMYGADVCYACNSK